jgi:hypothetical protein
MVEMGMFENGSLIGCSSMSSHKTSPIQTDEGGFFDASNCYYSLKTENETPKKVWKSRTAMFHAPGGIQTHTSTHQFAFEKAIDAAQRWYKLSLDVCHV